MESLRSIVHIWIGQINQKLGKSEKADLVLYGSMATGSALADDDVDIVILAPEYVDK